MENKTINNRCNTCGYHGSGTLSELKGKNPEWICLD
jgi:hypothetical protein